MSTFTKPTGVEKRNTAGHPTSSARQPAMKWRWWDTPHHSIAQAQTLVAFGK